ncbi:ATP-binding protein [Streptomyces fildesensis]|uniref:ATP-binding protein n=1 Tax=Streptomyces fildesensis TaxID=375757 RepID=UPI0018DFD452|nr:ATP-binding protein [Streptomyces fildesensis]
MINNRVPTITGEGPMTVEVTDSGTHIPQLRHAESGDESGRGLLLVDALATDWGTRPTDDGKTVWFMVPLKQPEPLG